MHSPLVSLVTSSIYVLTTLFNLARNGDDDDNQLFVFPFASVTDLFEHK